jgi:arylsulfatase A-like enzyme
MVQPNILWICTDRQRHDTLGCYGNRFVTTPHLDALAAGGAQFEQAWCQNPICAPSRASFLTGRYPRTTRVNRNAQALPRDEKLISRLLADAGYVCGHAGKLHLAPSCPGLADWCEPRGDDGYSVFDWSMHPPATPVSQYTAWLSEHDIAFQREPVMDSPYVTFGMPSASSNTGWIAQRGINFIKCSAALNRPWFFTLNIEDPHDPFDPPREFLEPYLERLDEIPLPHYEVGELENKPIFQRTDRAGVWGSGRGNFAAAAMSATDHRLIRAAYWAMVDHIDFQVGRVLEALRETGQFENTLVLFISDHGEMLGDHGFYFQCPYFYEEMCRVPFLMSLPGQIKAQRVPALVELVDIAPTLLEAAGMEPYGGIQGRSLWPILTGKADAAHHRDDVYAEYYRAIPTGHKNAGGAFITGVRNREYAFSAVHGEDCGELYDLKNDPTETHNLWDDPAHLAVKAQMLKRLCDRMAQTIDPLPVCQASY